jgi:hypothetical protein
MIVSDGIPLVARRAMSGAPSVYTQNPGHRVPSVMGILRQLSRLVADWSALHLLNGKIADGTCL